MRTRLGVRLALGLALVCLLGAACSHGYGGSDRPTPPPSGALGPVTQDAADEAIAGLCEISAEHTDDLNAASEVFFDRSHEELHVIAAAAEVTDRSAAGAVLESKQIVEADLASDELPEGFGADVDALIAATQTALGAIGVEAASCRS